MSATLFYLGLYLLATGSMWVLWLVAIVLVATLVGYFIKQSSLRQKVNEVIEAKSEWTADPEVLKATDAMESGKLDEAAAILRKYLAAKPGSVDALTLLKQVFWKQSDMPAYQQATIQLVQLHLKLQDNDLAWSTFEEYSRTGGTAMPPATWLEIARMLEAQQEFDNAVTEYENLAAAHPTSKQSLLALLAAGRLCLKHLERPADALRNYQTAAASRVPHLDWDANIHAGITDAEQALAATPAKN